VPEYVVTSPQVFPKQHSVAPEPAVHAYPRCVQHSPWTQARFRPAQHWDEVVQAVPVPAPEFEKSRQLPQCCAPVAPVQVYGPQQIVDPPATQLEPSPEQHVPGTPCAVEVQLPPAHSWPSRHQAPSGSDRSGQWQKPSRHGYEPMQSASVVHASGGSPR
jgi:hypothetical protein